MTTTTAPLEADTDTRRELPEGWRWAKLGDVAIYINGMAFKPDDWEQFGTPIIRIQNLNDPKAPFNYSTREVDERYRVTDGDLLISWSASLDAFVWDRGPAILNQHIFKVIEHSDIIRRDYLYYAVREAMDEIRAQVHGATMRHITRPEFEAIMIPLPPLPEQRRLAALLDEALALVAQARAAAEARLEAARALPAALLREVFESEEARGWPHVSLGEVGSISSGITLGRSFDGILTRRVPYLRVANVKDGCLDLNDVYEISVPESDITKCRLQYGDLLLTEGGDPDKLGRGTFWEEQIPECIHQNHIFRVRFDLNCFLPEFLSWQIGSSYGKGYFLAHAKQTTGIATINQRVLAGFPLLVPPIATQRQIVKYLTELTAGVETMSVALQAQLDALNALPAALLHRAFAGEL